MPRKRWKKRWRPSKRVTVRRKLLAKGGARCFLVPNRKAPKYPVCDSRGQVTCQGLWAAFNRARMNRKGLIRWKAMRKAKAKGCEWARGKRA